MVVVEERISLLSIGEHVNMLVKDNSRKGNAQGMLEAKMLAGEAKDILRMIKTVVETDGQRGGRRDKRNVLGDIISSLTGLATQDTIMQQQAYDKELRRKMEELVRTQQVEANTIEKLLDDIAREEETLDGKISQLQQVHLRDMAYLQQHGIRKHMVAQDLKVMTDILASTYTGFATPVQVMRFTARMKGGNAHNFQLHGLHIAHDTLVAQYSALLYIRTSLTSVKKVEQAWHVRTDRNTFMLMDQPDMHNIHITQHEARLLGGTCEQCTIAVHTGHGWYKTLKDGWLNCTNTGNSTFRSGTLLHVSTGEQCHNDIMHIHTKQDRQETLSIDMTAEDTVDEQILQKYIDKGSKVEGIRKVKQQHLTAQRQLHKSILTAQQEMDALTAWADRLDEQNGGTAWLTYAVYGMLMVFVVGLGAWLGWRLHRFLMARKASGIDDDTERMEEGEDQYQES